MQRVLVPAALSLVLLLSLAHSTPAQSIGVTTGSINGVVRDDHGDALPGATITLSGPAQMGTRQAVTDDRGGYRFPSLSPGEYRLLYELAGMQSLVREGILVSVGFIATVDVQLQLATVQETVTVSGASPVVDGTTTRIQ